MRKRSTLKELAQSLDLSVATVSRALGGYEDIAAKTRERVNVKAREIGYVPNSAGRMLVSGKSGFVGLVVPAHGAAFLDSFLGQFVLGLGEGLASHGCDLFMSIASEGQSEIDVIAKLVDSGRADRFELTRITEDDERVRYLQSRHVPFVTHGRLAGDESSYSWLDTDGATAFAEAFERLYALGHRRFGLVTISEPMNAKRDREAGLLAAMAAKADPSVSLQRVEHARDDFVNLRGDIANLLQSAERPTAILGLFDELALIVMHEATRLGIKIPEQLSVIGFDNLASAGLASPGLSTFDQDVKGSAKSLGRMIHQLMETPNAALNQLTKAKFVPRGSHGRVDG